MLWKLWEIEVRVATSEALIHGYWICGIADVVKDLTLKAWKASYIPGGLCDETCLACAAYWKPRSSTFPMYVCVGDRDVPILLILF